MPESAPTFRRAAAKRFYEGLGFVAPHEGLKLHLKTR